MRILVLSNLYPPHTIGGYELACYDVVEELRSRGHDVSVLTSTYGVDRPIVDQGISRILHFFEYSRYREIMYTLWWHQYRDQQSVRSAIKQLRPDLLYIWNLERLTYRIIPVYERSGLPVVYAISSYWMLKDPVYQEWQNLWNRHAQNPWRHLLKAFFRACLPSIETVEGVEIPCEYAHFFSEHLRQEHKTHQIEASHSTIIYHGIHVDDFDCSDEAPLPEPKNSVSRLLYSGQIGKHKGVITAIEALNVLIHQKGYRNLSLSLVGPAPFPEYTTELNRYIAEHELTPYIHIMGKISREELIQIYRQHHMLIFPSIWPEPFSITILEAMAAQLPIIATPTGGSAEILRHEENCLTFEPQNSRQLADRIEQLLTHDELRQTIIKNASELIQKQFSIPHIVDSIEGFLQNVMDIHREK